MTPPESVASSGTDAATANASSWGPWPHITALIVDDEPGMRNFLVRALQERCGSVEAVDSVEAAEDLFARRLYDLIVLDIALPGKSGVAWLHELRARGYSGEVILITAFANLETAIDALRAGASDFILKPFRLAQMLNAVKRCVDRSLLVRENFLLRRELAGRELHRDGLIGKNPAMLRLGAMIARLAPAPATVLLQGESGTGKEVAARALHRLSGRQGPFVPLNCAAVSPELIESELFGHVRGAFTGASGQRDGLFYYARGGTLFLDEVGELPLPMQAKLLRVLEEHKIRPVGSEQEVTVDVRVIAATNRVLEDEVKAGRFRQDLLFRLDVVNLTLPPLRERREDIPDLIVHFVDQLAPRLGLPAMDFTPAVIAGLQRYAWPGNVRELRNLIERTLILGGVPDDFPGLSALAGDIAPLTQAPANAPGVATLSPAPATTDEDADLPLEAIEKRHILRTLARVAGNKSEAARRLGVSRKTLERRCAEWGL